METSRFAPFRREANGNLPHCTRGIAVSVAGVIEPALQAAEMRRSAARPTTDLTAYALYLRALAVFFPVTKERLIAALGLLLSTLDPGGRSRTAPGIRLD